MKKEMLKGEIDAPRHNREKEHFLGNGNIVLTDNDILHLRVVWDNKIADLVGGILLEIPPFREVNHVINLIDPEK